MTEQLRTIERESRRCGDLVKNLLTFARQAPSHRDANELNTVVERAVTLVRHKLELQGIELEERLRRGRSRRRCATPTQIQQVVLVLLVNAAEAMPSGGRLEVATEIDPAGESLHVRVRDTGGGIPPEVLPQIFDPFFTTKEDQQRTGLGLAVARSIVEQHGGRDFGPLGPRRGTEFTITLPVAGAGGGDGRRAEARRNKVSTAEAQRPVRTKGRDPDRGRRTGGARFAGQVVRQRRLPGQARGQRARGAGSHPAGGIRYRADRYQDAGHGRHGAADPAARGRPGPDRDHHDRLRVRGDGRAGAQARRLRLHHQAGGSGRAVAPGGEGAGAPARAPRGGAAAREPAGDLPQHRADRQEPGHEERGGA